MQFGRRALAQTRDVLDKCLGVRPNSPEFREKIERALLEDAWSLLAPTENNRRCRESVSCFREALRSYSSAESRRAVAWEQEVFVYRGTGALSLKASLGALNYTVKTIRTVPAQFYRKDRKGRSRALRQPDGPTPTLSPATAPPAHSAHCTTGPARHIGNAIDTMGLSFTLYYGCLVHAISSSALIAGSCGGCSCHQIVWHSQFAGHAEHG